MLNKLALLVTLLLHTVLLNYLLHYVLLYLFLCWHYLLINIGYACSLLIIHIYTVQELTLHTLCDRSTEDVQIG